MKKTTWLLATAACAAGLFLLSSKANAELVVHTAGMHVGSHHFPNEGWNNVNPGVYLRGSINSRSDELRWLDGDYVVGAYYNSERKGSLYAGRIYPIAANLDVVVGVISGYKAAPILPMVVPSVHFRLLDGWNARVHYLPKIEKSGAHVVHLSLERKF